MKRQKVLFMLPAPSSAPSEMYTKSEEIGGGEGDGDGDGEGEGEGRDGREGRGEREEGGGMMRIW